MEQEEEFAWASREMATLLEEQRSCVLGTASASGRPLSSYAPFWRDAEGAFYVFVSALAQHYGHLSKTERASVMVIEDEASSENLFARKRLTVDCACERLAREAADWSATLDAMEARLGATLGHLRGMADFDLFRLTPKSGRLVLGFGKAYRIAGKRLDDIGYIGTGGHREK